MATDTKQPRRGERRAPTKRRKVEGRRREDRGEASTGPRPHRTASGQLPMFGTEATPPERRRLARRLRAADRRALADAERRAAKLARAATAAAKKSRLVPCADDSPYLNSEQAAAFIGTTRHGLYNMVRRGHIQAYRRTGARRGVMLFKRTELETFLERRRS